MTRSRCLFSSLLPLAIVLTIAACSSAPDKAAVTHDQTVNLDRYMGPWYILASIPLALEKGAHNPVESYTRNPDGSIAAVFQFRDKSFDGTQKTHVTNATVNENSGNAVWKIQVWWPLRSEYRIAYVEPDYSYAIIGRSKRDHVWLIGRKPRLSDAAYSRYSAMIKAMGYDLKKFSRTQQNGEFPTPGLSVSVPAGMP